MADQSESVTDSVVDPYFRMGFVRNSDGSFTRKGGPEEITKAANAITSVSSYAGNQVLLVKDITINQSKNTWIRVFLPRQTLESSALDTKLPLIVFFHGGGFIYFSAASTITDYFYATATVEIPAILVSVEYRLAPEHRLPAAYDDGTEALHWMKNSQDEWFSKYADFSNTFIMGCSAGGNIAYQVGLRAASSESDDSLKPLNIKGLILHQPFFGGTKRTQSELRSVGDMILSYQATDVMWELALPTGTDRDHEYCNPILGAESNQFAQIKALGWKILITGNEGDPLIDRQIEFLKMLQEKSVETVGNFEEGGFHGIEGQDPSKCKALCNLVGNFVKSCMSA